MLGLSVSRVLGPAPETVARERGCAKLILEVLEGNVPAQRLYQSLGYGDYVLSPPIGSALIWQKTL